MFLSWWRAAAMRRMTRAAARTPRTGLRVEPLEARENPAGILASPVAPGNAPVVAVYDAATQTQQFTITAYDNSFTGGVNVAVGDVDGDGTPDVITGAGAGGGPVVNVFSGKDGHLLGTLTAGDDSSRAGVTVAAADYDGDGKADVVVGTMRNGEPLVQVIRFADQSVLHGYTPFTGVTGVSVAAADVDGDGVPDTIVGAGSGGAPLVAVYSGKTDAALATFDAFEDTFTGGVTVSAGDLDGDGKAEVVAAAGNLGGPRVQAFDGTTGTPTLNFFAYDESERNGVLAAVLQANGTPTLVTMDGADQPTNVKAFDARTLASVTAPTVGMAAAPVDTTAPTVTVSTTAADPTNANPIPFTAACSEPVNGFSAAGITVANGTVSNFASTDAKTYTFDVTPTADGAVTVTVAAGAATDAAGNANAASAAVSVTSDTTAPAVTAAALTTASTTPTLTGTVDDPAATVTVTVGGQTLTATVSGTSWSAVVTSALTAGTYEIAVSATDTAGNTGTATQTGGLVIDTTAPAVALTSSANEPTAANPIPVTATFSEAVTGFTAAGVTVTNGAVTNFAAVDATTYTFDVVPAGSGTVTVSVAAGAAADAAGNANTASAALTRTFNGTITTPTITTTAADPTNDASIPITVTFSGDVTGFDATKVTVDNGTVSDFTAVSASTYTFDVTPAADGAVAVTVPAAAATDAVNAPTAAATFTTTSDRSAPTATVTAAAATNANPIPFTVTFSEPVTGFTAASVSAANGTVGSVTTVDSHTYTVFVTPAGEEAVTLTVNAGGAADTAGNELAAAASGSATYDATAPTATIVSSASDPTETTPIPFVITFSEPVTGFTTAGLTVTNGTVGNFTAQGDSSYAFTVTPTAQGAVSVSVAAGVAADAAGNPNAAVAAVSRTFDGVVAVDASGVPATMPDVNSASWQTQADGLRTWDVQTGTGAAVTSGSTVSVYYTGWVAADGTVFDSNATSGSPTSFALSGLIAGWQEGLVGMQPGGIRYLYIPAALGYGDQASGSIPANSDLVFAVKLVSTT
jgi:hypothetical protein